MNGLRHTVNPTEISIMKNITFYFSTIILTTLLSCDTYNRPYRVASKSAAYNNKADMDMPNEPGKCYAKCLTPEIIEEVNLSYEIYQGNDPEILNNYVKTEVIELAPASNKWVKKIADRNCDSPDPNDCQVWCLIEEPAQNITVENMLMDTSVTKEYITETHTTKYLSQAKNLTVWQAILCDPDDSQLKAIQNALNDRGYDLSVEILQRNFGSASKKALTKYQQDNYLHVGGITEESMESLGIDY